MSKVFEPHCSFLLGRLLSLLCNFYTKFTILVTWITKCSNLIKKSAKWISYLIHVAETKFWSGKWEISPLIDEIDGLSIISLSDRELLDKMRFLIIFLSLVSRYGWLCRFLFDL